MPAGNPTGLLRLSDREFRQLSEARPTHPRTSKFKPIRLNVTKLDQSWDRKRGAAVRLTAVLLLEDAATLERRVCESEKAVRIYTTAADWLQRESTYLRKVARLLDTAGGRLTTVLSRCQETTSP